MITMALVEPDNQPDVRCTEAVLNAFGIYGIAPRDGGGVLEALVAHGYGYAQVDFEFGQTLQSFVAQYPQGDYYMFSSGHAMALRDGVLTDTEDKGPNRRRLQGAYRIRKRIEASLRMNAQYATMSAQDFMQKFKVGWTLSGPNPTWELVQRELQDDYVVKAIVEDLRNGVGIQSPVVVEGATQTVIDGHHRVIACLLTNIPVPYVVQPTYKLVDGKMVAVGVQKQAFDEWQDENCGLYAQALMQLKPGLRLGIIGGGDQISESKKVQIGRYSSYRAVRSYLEDCGYSGEGMTKCWDIASKIKESKLVAYKDGRKIEHNRESFLILKDQQWIGCRV